MKLSLIVIDMQKKFFEGPPQRAQSLANAVLTINAAIALFRNNKLPIIVIEHQDAEDGLLPGTPGFATHDSINLNSSDTRITKTYGNAFNKTPLAEALRSRGVDTIIITGFCAENCILSTCRGAKDHDFKPIILRGSLASGIAERIRFVEDINEIISLEALRAIL